MPPFPKPTFDYEYNSDLQINALRQWRDTQPGRAIPVKQQSKLLLGSWNIANLGDAGQIRADRDIAVMAEILSWFDLVALQEVKENLADLDRILAHMPGYEAVFSDQSGNDERMAYIYDTARITRLPLAGEIDIPPSSQRHIKISGSTQKFSGFDRAPYTVAFQCEDFVLTLVNVHLFFGSSSKTSLNRRALETYAAGRWADLRRKRGRAFSNNVVVIGDMNMPKAEVGDEVYDALRKRGLHIPTHQSRIGTTITEGKHYDQLAFFPGDAGRAYIQDGVFDFDGGVFADLWQARTSSEFETYLRYHLSDHRPIWVQFDTDPV